MPALIPNGPNLPIELMEAQMSGDLVIFAGAGASSSAGFPSFKDLVRRVYCELAESFHGFEENLFSKGEYDRVLGLLEERVGPSMRRAVCDILTPAEESNIEVHRALLDISRTSSRLRLVTTNFDRLFLKAGARQVGLAVAPQLPVPRKTHWHGLVHLHGLIEEDDREGNNLVLTSADFGRAYLLDRWASRFVSELVQNFHVLFVGYGINDPVMRYLLDSLAAERKRGEQQFKGGFVFAGVKGSEAKRKQLMEEWNATGVEPIFYNAGWKHRALTKTLARWSELCRGGLRTRRAWALRKAEKAPSNPNEEDAHFVVWALSEPSGAVARAWADKKAAPDIGWLEVFEKCAALPKRAKLLESPVVLEMGQGDAVTALRLPIAGPGWLTTQPLDLSEVTRQLGRWLARHLDKAALLAWVLRKGGVLHPNFRQQVRERLEKDGQTLSDPLRKVWEVLSSEAYSARMSKPEPSYNDLLSRGQHSPVACLEMMRLLRPVPELSPRRSDDLRSRLAKEAGIPHAQETPTTPADLVDVKLRLAGGTSAPLLLQQLVAAGTDSPLLVKLAEACVGLLEEALEWLAYLGFASSEVDLSHVFMPSITPHSQNRHFDDWTWLIDLNRKAFEALDEAKPERARRLVERWIEIQFPIFRRLALHAATQGKSVEADLGAQLLLARNRSTLWSIDERRECLRFLRVAGGRLSAEVGEELLARISEGPPRKLYSARMHEEEFEERRDKAIWRRLARLERSGLVLSGEATAFLRRISKERCLSIPEDHTDEFPFWVGEVTSVEPLEGRDWRPLARSRPTKILVKLTRDAKANKWDPEVWAPALQEFGTPDYSRSFDRRRFAVAATLAHQAPVDFLKENIHTLAFWLREQASELPPECEEQFLNTWKKLEPLAQLEEADLNGEPVYRTLNHPAGQLTEALLQRLWTRGLRPGDGLPTDLKQLLRQAALAAAPAASLARVFLASTLLSLFLLDREWTEEVLLPYFSWSDVNEAVRMWSGYLWRPRFNPDLVAAYKANFLLVFDHLDRLKPGRENASRLLVFVSVDSPQVFTRQEISQVLQRLPEEDLASAAQALTTLLEENEKPEELWERTLKDWVVTHWPVSGAARSSAVSRSLGEMLLRTGDAFPKALQEIRDHLGPIKESGDYLLCILEEIGLASKCPESVLGFLERIIPQAADPWMWSGLRSTLDTLSEAAPRLSEDHRYRRLDDLLLTINH